MKDEFKAEFLVDIDRQAVLDALSQPIEGFEPVDEQGRTRYLLPGFPSMKPVAAPGAVCTEIDVQPGKLLRVRKVDEPCAGTEIGIYLKDTASGTSVTIVQSGFGPWFEQAKDTIVAHGLEIVADFQLYLERGYRVPPKRWGVHFGAATKKRPTGLVLQNVQPDTFAGRAGMRADDLLVSFRGVRIYDTGQFWTALALSTPGEEAQVEWLRGKDLHTSRAAF